MRLCFPGMIILIMMIFVALLPTWTPRGLRPAIFVAISHLSE